MRRITNDWLDMNGMAAGWDTTVAATCLPQNPPSAHDASLTCNKGKSLFFSCDPLHSWPPFLCVAAIFHFYCSQSALPRPFCYRNGYYLAIIHNIASQLASVANSFIMLAPKQKTNQHK